MTFKWHWLFSAKNLGKHHRSHIVASKWLSVSAVQAAVTQPVVVEKNSLLWSDTEYFPKWSGKHYVTRGSLSGGRDFSQSQVSLVQNRYLGVTGATATRYLGPSPSHHSYLCTTGPKIRNVLLLKDQSWILGWFKLLLYLLFSLPSLDLEMSNKSSGTLVSPIPRIPQC